MRPSFARALARQSLAFLFVLSIAAAVPAQAGNDTPYVGAWVLELRNCGAEESSPDGPMLVAEDRYDQDQTHCEFKSVAPSGADFQISADCTVGGNKQAAAFTLTVSGDTLTFTDDGGARDFLRCK
jgi:hypothetical protein